MTLPLRFLLLCFLSFNLLLTSCAEEETNEVDGFTKPNPESIESSQLFGEWQLSAMIADTAVDINRDGVANKNLLAETTCFDSMAITFNLDMSFSSVNSGMEIKNDQNQEEVICMANRTDAGTWSIEGNVLKLNMNYDAGVYTHEMPIILVENTFSFDISKFESEAYLNDPGDTSISGVTIFSLEYTRTQE